jgi:hypothetical protein
MGTGNPFVRTVIVSPGANPSASGTALISNINTVAGRNPSAMDRWVIHIEPGIFDVGTVSVVMPQFVDLEGSGQLSTTIRGKGSKTAAILVGANDTELRDLTVICDATGTADGECFTMVNPSSVSMMITDVTLETTGTTTLGVALLIQGGSTQVTNSTLFAFGNEANGLVVGDGFPTFTNLSVFGRGGASSGGAGITGVNVFNNASPTFTDSTVTVVASPSPSPATGLLYAYGSPSPPPTGNPIVSIDGTTIQAVGAGSAVGIEMAASVLDRAIVIRNSVVSGATESFQGDNSAAQIAAVTANTQIVGIFGLGTNAFLLCTNDYDSTFTPLTNGVADGSTPPGPGNFCQ